MHQNIKRSESKSNIIEYLGRLCAHEGLKNAQINLSQWIKFGALIGLCSLPLIARNIGYDAAGRIVWSIQPSGQTTTFKYDANGNIEAIAAITPAEDTDADGMPDYFEIQFAGHATGLVATEDTDQDGMNHLFEFAFAKDLTITDKQDITPISLEVPDPLHFFLQKTTSVHHLGNQRN